MFGFFFLLFVSVVDIWFEIIWNIIVYDFTFNSLVCRILTMTMKMNLMTIMIVDNEAVLWAALKRPLLFWCLCWIWKETERKRKMRSEWTHTDWGQKRLLLFSCRVESPTVKDPAVHPMALTRRWPRPWGTWGPLSSDDNTCPYYVYITLMLKCNLSAVAAWRHSLRVYRSSDVWICTVHASVCVLVSREEICLSSRKKNNTCMHPPTTAAHT